MDNCCSTCGRRLPSKTAYGLTPRTLDLYNFVTGYIAQHKVSPTYDEMMIALGLRSKAGIHRMIKMLEERGLIDRIPFKRRTVVAT